MLVDLVGVGIKESLEFSRANELPQLPQNLVEGGQDICGRFNLQRLLLPLLQVCEIRRQLHLLRPVLCLPDSACAGSIVLRRLASFAPWARSVKIRDP